MRIRRIAAVSALAFGLLAGPVHAITLEQGQQQFDRMNARMQEQADQLREAQDQRNLMQQLERMNQELRQLHRDNEEQLAPDDGDSPDSSGFINEEGEEQ